MADGLATYGRIWGLYWFLEVYIVCGGVLEALTPSAIIMFVFAVGALSGYTIPILAGHMAALVWFFWIKPLAYDADHWVAHLDLCVVLACAVTVVSCWRTPEGWISQKVVLRQKT